MNKKWEYKVLSEPRRRYLDKQLNELGRAGWEVVSGAGGGMNGGSLWVLKRPL